MNLEFRMKNKMKSHGAFYVALSGVVWVVFIVPVGATAGWEQQPELEITRLDGQIQTGRLIHFAPDEISLRTDQGAFSLGWSEVLSVRPIGEDANNSQSPVRFPLWFDLADGSSFAGEISSADEGGFVVRTSIAGPAQLDPAAIRSIRVHSADEAAREKLAEIFHEYDNRSNGTATVSNKLEDVALVARGEEVIVLRGRIVKIEQERVLFEWNGRRRSLPWSRLGGLVLARSAVRSASCLVRLCGGDVFAGRIVGGSERTVLLRSSLFEHDVELPFASVKRIDCRSERLVFLSDLQPSRYEFEPFFDKKWEYATDQTLSGRPIRLSGQTIARGLVMHSRAGLTYRLEGRFEQFAAVAGIVDEMDRRGCVAMRVLGDGRVLWEADGLRGGAPPREVITSVAGVRELTLVVDYDEELDLSDHAAWGLARLIR